MTNSNAIHMIFTSAIVWQGNQEIGRYNAKISRLARASLRWQGIACRARRRWRVGFCSRSAPRSEEVRKGQTARKHLVCLGPAWSMTSALNHLAWSPLFLSQECKNVYLYTIQGGKRHSVGTQEMPNVDMALLKFCKNWNFVLSIWYQMWVFHTKCQYMILSIWYQMWQKSDYCLIPNVAEIRLLPHLVSNTQYHILSHC